VYFTVLLFHKALCSIMINIVENGFSNKLVLGFVDMVIQVGKNCLNPHMLRIIHVESEAVIDYIFL
jgi:hypothetical protein